MKYRYLITALALTSIAHADLASVRPQVACNYLTGTGLPTTTYRQQADGGYRCSSPHIDIGTVPGTQGRMNNIAYAASGDAQSIAKLQLTIDVDNTDQAAAIHRRLKDVAGILARKLGVELSSATSNDIANGKAGKGNAGKYAVTVVRLDRPAGGYEISVIFE